MGLDNLLKNMTINSPEGKEMDDILMKELRLKIYRVASLHYLEQKKTEGLVPVNEDDVRFLQSFIDEFLHGINLSKADLKQELLVWAGNCQEEKLRPSLIQFIENIFNWGV